ncbi:hypothetical protein RHMOL_Rhmol07G0077900 [Rhododendron molle]|uniref:Uncharacterized protein n=1 Tax=Rhododendron molle TaxID=49168 RepID=A0ACC0MYG1_RHOML|nr:hypothetical protein RHMOL_Rhmol07G0077900 [Rhododendron molle]
MASQFEDKTSGEAAPPPRGMLRRFRRWRNLGGPSRSRPASVMAMLLSVGVVAHGKLSSVREGSWYASILLSLLRFSQWK